MKDDFRNLIDFFDNQRDSFIPTDFTEKQKDSKKKQKQIINRKSGHLVLDNEVIINPIIKDVRESLDKKVKVQVEPGFDLNSFDKIMRQELINTYKKFISFEHPYISFIESVTCIRQQYYKRKNYPLNLERLFAASNLFLIKEIDDYVLGIIQEYYPFGEKNKQIVSNKYFAKGIVHAIDKSTGFLYLINSIDPYNFSNEVKINHKNIANIQSYILNTEYNYNISKFVVLYVLRDLKTIKRFVFNVNNDQAKVYLHNALILKKALTIGSVPDILGKTEAQCKVCLFSKFCNNDNKKTDDDIQILL